MGENDDMLIPPYSDDTNLDREEEWREGRHHTKDGDVLRIQEMSDKHLVYTIKYFERELDVSPLVKEQERRKRLKARNKKR